MCSKFVKVIKLVKSLTLKRNFTFQDIIKKKSFDGSKYTSYLEVNKTL